MRRRGACAPSTLKASIGYHDGYIGEGQISYAGPNARRRAELARDIILASDWRVLDFLNCGRTSSGSTPSMGNSFPGMHQLHTR